MGVEVNYLGVLLAALSTMIVGSLWYASNMPTGKWWMKLTGHKMDPNFPASKMAIMYLGAFVASFITAYVLAHVSFLSNRFFGYSFLQDTLTTGFWLWLGFVVARIYVHDSFEGRPGKLTLLTAAHELLTIEIMAFIIGLMGH